MPLPSAARWERQDVRSEDTSRAEKRSDDRDKVSSFFQDQTKVPKIDHRRIDRETELNSESQNDLEAWLGVRDGIRNYLITAA